eukprot:PhF_6_TR19094/c0_g1_i2/m.28089
MEDTVNSPHQYSPTRSHYVLNPLMLPSMYDVGRGTRGRGPEKANEDYMQSVQSHFEKYWQRKAIWEAEQRSLMSHRMASSSPREKNALKLQKERAKDRLHHINDQMIKQRKADEKLLEERKQAAISAKGQMIQMMKSEMKQRQTMTREQTKRRMAKEIAIRKSQHRDLVEAMEAQKSEDERIVLERLSVLKEFREESRKRADIKRAQSASLRDRQIVHVKEVQARKEQRCKDDQEQGKQILHDIVRRIYDDEKTAPKNRWRQRMDRSSEIYKAITASHKEAEALKLAKENEIKAQAAVVADSVRTWEKKQRTKLRTTIGGKSEAILRQAARNRLEKEEHKKEIEEDKDKEVQWCRNVVEYVRQEREEALRRRKEKIAEMMRPKSAPAPPPPPPPQSLY